MAEHQDSEKKKEASSREQDKKTALLALDSGAPNDDTAPMENDESWLTTYSDLITLLITLFVVLISNSTVKDGETNKKATQYLYEQFMIQSDQQNAAIYQCEGNAECIAMIVNADRNKEDETKASIRANVIEQHFKKIEVDSLAFVDVKDNLIRIRLSADILFDENQTSFDFHSKHKLARIIKELMATESKIIIAGHSDNVPPTSSRYKTSWDIAAARAALVVSYFIEQGVDPKRIELRSYGDTDPVSDNTTEYGRKLNRRVEILLTDE